MKRQLLLIITLIIIVVFQSSNIIEGLKVGNIKPNIILLYVIYISLNTNIIVAQTIGFFAGIIEDILSQSLIGINALSKTLLAFFLNHFKTRIYTEKALSVIIVVFFTSILIRLFYFLLIFIFVNKVNFYHSILKIVIPEAVYNAAVSVIIFPLFRSIVERKRIWQRRL